MFHLKRGRKQLKFSLTVDFGPYLISVIVTFYLLREYFQSWDKLYDGYHTVFPGGIFWLNLAILCIFSCFTWHIVHIICFYLFYIAVHDWYHAFVFHAKKDRAFVEKLVKKMENPPYKLRLCFSERDFLGGGYHLETTAVAIEKRCKKFIAVLSSNFDDSEGATFKSHIAMSLSAS